MQWGQSGWPNLDAAGQLGGRDGADFQSNDWPPSERASQATSKRPPSGQSITRSQTGLLASSAHDCHHQRDTSETQSASERGRPVQPETGPNWPPKAEPKLKSSAERAAHSLCLQRTTVLGSTLFYSFASASLARRPQSGPAFWAAGLAHWTPVFGLHFGADCVRPVDET